MKSIIGLEGGDGGCVVVGAAAIWDDTRRLVKNAVSGQRTSRASFDASVQFGRATMFSTAIPLHIDDVDDDGTPPLYVMLVKERFAREMRVEHGTSLWALLEASEFRRTTLPTLLNTPVEHEIEDGTLVVVFPSLGVFQDYMTGVISRFLAEVGYGPIDHPGTRAVYYTLKSLHVRCILWGELVGSRFWGNPYEKGGTR